MLFGENEYFSMKIIAKIIYNLIIGGIVLLFINLIGGVFNFHIALNAISALVVGSLGIPGVVLLVILKFIFKI